MINQNIFSEFNLTWEEFEVSDMDIIERGIMMAWVQDAMLFKLFLIISFFVYPQMRTTV